jgi:hypothetical protein
LGQKDSGGHLLDPDAVEDAWDARGRRALCTDADDRPVRLVETDARTDYAGIFIRLSICRSFAAIARSSPVGCRRVARPRRRLRRRSPERLLREQRSL